MTEARGKNIWCDDTRDNGERAWDTIKPAHRRQTAVSVGGQEHKAFDPPAPPAWMRDAECRDWQELFDQVYDYPRKSRVDACKKVCAACPVIEQCLTFAMEQENDDTIYRYGVFGGKSGKERIALRERQQGARTDTRRLESA